MKKLTRLLALTLAAAMLLSAGAMAAEREGGGARLVWNWLDWDEGHFVSDDALSGRNPGDEELHMVAGDDYCGIFFTIGADGRRSPVVPKAGKGITIEKLSPDEIASGAKQSQYYVRIRLDGWQDSELTSGSASMKVIAELPDAGLYTTAGAARDSYLHNDRQPYDPSQLSNKTVYFVFVPPSENSRRVTDVQKNPSGSSSLYDLEKVSDNVWKITLRIDEGGAGVNLDVSFQEPDGSSYTEERGWWFEYPRGPELWLQWINWEDDPEPDSEIHRSRPQVTPVDEYHMAFYICENDGEKLTPVPVSQLKASAGVTIAPLAPGVKGKEAYAVITVAGWDQEYAISCGEHTITLESRLPDVDLYSGPAASTDSLLRPWRYSPTNENAEAYLISTCTDEKSGRHLESISLSKNGEDNGSFSLEKVSSDVYKLTRKTIEGGREHIARVDVTWRDTDGNTYTDSDCKFWAEAYTSTVISEKPIAGVQTIEDSVPYKDLSAQLTTSLTLNAGETKTIYIGGTYCPRGEWAVWAYYPEAIYTSSAALKLTPVGGGDLTKYTIRCDVPGVYELGVSPVDFMITDVSGRDISDTFDHYIDYEEGKGWYAVDYDEASDTFIPVNVDVTITGKPVGAAQGWFPVTVTVTGEASRPAFPDVAASAWYAPAVAFASINGYMNGNADGTFNPEGQVQGAQLAQILYNKENQPAAADGAAFQGVDSQWYAPAVLWAAGAGLITDAGSAAVTPEASLTRQQIALMLYNYMGRPSGGADLSRFADADKVSSWALDAVKWAVSASVLNGSENGGVLTLDPTGTATRAQTAQILMNLFG